MTNQQHVACLELAEERQRLSVVRDLLRSRCDAGNIGFVTHGQSCDWPVKYKKILYYWPYDLFSFDQFEHMSDQMRSRDQQIYILCNNWVDESLFVKDNAKVFSRPKLLGLNACLDSVPQPAANPRLFNCFMHRVDGVRQSWLYKLCLENLIDQGHISYLLYQINTDLTGLKLFDHIHNMYLGQVPQFHQAWQHLRTQIPFDSYANIDDLTSVICDTKYSLVLDTYATDDDCGSWYTSEKVTRALQMPTTNLLFVQQGTLAKLKSLEIYIEPEIMAVDSLSWIERQQAILDVLRRDAITNDAKHRQSVAAYHRHLFKSFYQMCMDAKFFDEIFDSIMCD